MHQASPVTNLVLAVLAAAGLLPVLNLPFFAHAQKYDSEGVERNGEQIYRWFTTPADPITGVEAMTTSRQILLGIVVATVALCLLMAIGPLRRFVRDALKIVPIAAAVLVAAKLFDQPQGNIEVRWGLFAAIALAAFMASSAFHGSKLPDPKPAPKPYAPPPGPAGSQAPPGF
jgi:hypothetical protein